MTMSLAITGQRAQLRTRYAWLTALLLFVNAALLVLTAGAQTIRSITVTEQALRHYAIKTVMPKYPAAARRKGAQGVVVAQLEVNEQGGLNKIEVLEAPDPSIEEAVRQAISEWRFKPATIGGKAVPLRGKLTFYYVIEKGKGRVKNPQQF